MKYLFFTSIVLFFITGFKVITPEIGEVIDQYNGVSVYYNGQVFSRTQGRHLGQDGYNFGLKYQCVEFVKRYYYQALNHKMPNTYGHAKDMFDRNLPDKAMNHKRGLMQYRNVREYKPKVDDILVYDSYHGNAFGHIAIISKVDDNSIEIVHQNMGKETRKKINLVHFETFWTVADYHVLGWLRKE
ncbi:MAG: CHAP domain-containing protein [Saprospiraceae bacterium]